MERLHKNHINFDEYAQVCATHDVTDIESQKLLSSYLHSIGSLLHFVEDISLRDFIILSPQWAVDAVYSVISDTSVKVNQGRFNQAFIDRVWHNYAPSEQTNLLQLMKKDNFEICYPLANDSHTYITPQLLPDTAPIYDFDTNDTLKFRFRYQFMPDGIMARLIVRLNEYIQDSLVWNRGVVIEDNGCLAQIIEEDSMEGKIIDIQINGNAHHRKFLLHTIRNEIESIHHKWFKNIKSEAMIPCNCSRCSGSEKPHYFAYTVLQRYRQKAKDTIECPISIEDLNVLLLLEGLFLKKESRDEKTLTKNEYNIHIQNLKEATMGNGNINFGNVGGNVGDITGGDKNVNSNNTTDKSISIGGNNTGIANMGNNNTITQTITTTNNDLKDLLEKLQVEANNVVEALPTEEAKESFKEDMETFMEKTQDNKLDKYFKVSKEGLLEATEAVGEVGIRAMGYIKQIVGLLG